MPRAQSVNQIKGHRSASHDGGKKKWWTGSVVEGRNIKVKSDWNLCMGSETCVSLAPGVFKLDWQKKKSVFDPAPLEVLDENGAKPEDVFLAAQSCPYGAIILEDADTGEVVFP